MNHRFLRLGILALVVVGGCGRKSGRAPVLVEKQKTSPKVTSTAEAGSVTDAQLLNAKFKGSHRKAAKTSVSDASVEGEFSTVWDLWESLPSDADMMEQFDDWAAETGQSKFTAPRFADEDRNVRVQAWLYAVKLEDDQDFHVIIGDSPNADYDAYLNVEVSGLPDPANSHTSTLATVRQQLFEILGNSFPRKKYKHLANPIPVEVEGSLFYDIDHGPGTVGPASRRPDTAWEIHPITDLDTGHN